MSTREQELREELAQLEAYAMSKHKAGDRHAVQDANSDMREIEARLDERQRTLAEVMESQKAMANAMVPLEKVFESRQAAMAAIETARSLDATLPAFVSYTDGLKAFPSESES